MNSSKADKTLSTFTGVSLMGVFLMSVLGGAVLGGAVLGGDFRGVERVEAVMLEVKERCMREVEEGKAEVPVLLEWRVRAKLEKDCTVVSASRNTARMWVIATMLDAGCWWRESREG
jgi:hypothetical protein